MLGQHTGGSSLTMLFDRGARAIARAEQACERAARLAGYNKQVRDGPRNFPDATRRLIRVCRLGAEDCMPALAACERRRSSSCMKVQEARPPMKAIAILACAPRLA